MKIIDDCPGAAPLKRPSIIFKTCPQCSEEIEMFTSDVKMDCENCGFTVYSDTMSCVEYCEYAKECVGEKIYNDVQEMVKKKKEQEAKEKPG